MTPLPETHRDNRCALILGAGGHAANAWGAGPHAGTNSSEDSLRHRRVDVQGISFHVVEAGSAEKPAVVFLHGWPEDWSAFRQVMVDLSEDAHVIAVDLPGIGDSQGLPRTNDKRTLASYVASLVGGLGLLDVTLVGHDVGGQIVYSYLRFDSGPLRKAVIMNVVVPGVDPWTEVKRNSKIWHFAFHAVPDLPEKLVWGQQRAYFDYFYDAISARKDGVKEDARKAYANAYSRREALHVGFEWYRAFAQDVKDNLSNTEPPVDTPVLYLRGDHEGDIQNYLEGFYESGLLNVQGCVIPECGHFAPDEQPGQVGKALRNFIFG